MAVHNVSSEQLTVADKARELVEFNCDEIIACAEGLRSLGAAIGETNGLGYAVQVLGNRVGELIEHVQDLLQEVAEAKQ